MTEDTHWNTHNMIYGDNPGNNPVPNIYAIRQSTNLYAYCMNNSLRFIDPSGNDVIDIIYGMSKTLDKNLFNKGVHDMLKSTIGYRDSYVISSEYDYYLGRVLGSAASAFMGAEAIISGVQLINMALSSGGALSLASKGTLSAGGIAIATTGTVAGAAVITYGGVVMSMSASQFGNDFKKLNEIGSGIKESKKDLVKLDDKYLKKNGIDPHTFKKDVLSGQSVKDKVVSHYDIFRNKLTNELFLVPKGNNMSIPTGTILN